MKVPDRIFISEKTAKIEGFFYKENALEYVRKDALLEWAKKKIAKGMIDEWDKGYVQCLKDLIDKLNNF